MEGEWVLEEGGCRMWRGNGNWRRGDGRGWRGRKLEDFDWVMIKFSDPSEGSVNMPIFPPHRQLMAVVFSIVLPFVFCWGRLIPSSVSPENRVIHPPTKKPSLLP